MGFISHFANTVKVVEMTQSQSGTGAVKAVELTKDEALKCRIYLLDAKDAREVQGRDGVVSSHRLMCQSQTDISKLDEIIDSDDPEAPKRYRVLYVTDRNDSGGIRHKEADLILID